jgi:methylated-DNA-[protein]-cysteine S-methyltransferase
MPMPEGDARDWILTRFRKARESNEPFKKISGLLRRYLNGEKVDLNVPLDLASLAPFTRQVLMETRKIPYGRTTSYGLIGKRLGYANAAQAVGQALKRNPIPLVIPCHRIVRGDGSLGGFDLGLDMKVKLLSLEGIQVNRLWESMILS